MLTPFGRSTSHIRGNAHVSPGPGATFTLLIDGGINKGNYLKVSSFIYKADGRVAIQNALPGRNRITADPNRSRRPDVGVTPRTSCQISYPPEGRYTDFCTPAGASSVAFRSGPTVCSPLSVGIVGRSRRTPENQLQFS